MGEVNDVGAVTQCQATIAPLTLRQKEDRVFWDRSRPQGKWNLRSGGGGGHWTMAVPSATTSNPVPLQLKFYDVN